MKKTFALDTISALLIILFLYTGIMKLTGFNAFSGVLKSHPFMKDFADIVAVTLPSLEILVAIMLMTIKWRKLGLYFSLALMLLFIGYIIWILFFSPDVPCTCGGVIEHMTWKQHFWFNTFFTTISALGIYLERQIRKQNISKNGAHTNLSYTT